VLFKLLGAPFSLPAAGLRFLFQQVADLADHELNDDTVVRDQLLLLQLRLEEGDIEEDDFAEQEAELLARLREIRARKRWEIEQVAAEELPAEANVEARRRVIVETPFDDQ
jgi:hypothetical protein